jgi:hypothetical protein
MKESFVCKYYELFSAGAWPVKNSDCRQIYFQASEHKLRAQKKPTTIPREIKERKIGLETQSFAGPKESKMCRIAQLENGTFSCAYELLDIHHRPR